MRALASRSTLSLLGAGLLLSLIGCLPIDGQLHGTMVVSSPPPYAEVVVVAPRAGYVWVDGQWMWANEQWGWYDGYWIAERHDHNYVGGRWEHRSSGYVWIEPRWVHVHSKKSVRIAVPSNRRPVRVKAGGQGHDNGKHNGKHKGKHKGKH